MPMHTLEVCVCAVCWQEAMELFKVAFRGKQNKLVKEIDVDHGLWIELLSRNVLTRQQIRDCIGNVCQYSLLCRIFTCN